MVPSLAYSPSTRTATLQRLPCGALRATPTGAQILALKSEHCFFFYTSYGCTNNLELYKGAMDGMYVNRFRNYQRGADEFILWFPRVRKRYKRVGSSAMWQKITRMR